MGAIDDGYFVTFHFFLSAVKIANGISEIHPFLCSVEPSCFCGCLEISHVVDGVWWFVFFYLSKLMPVISVFERVRQEDDCQEIGLDQSS